MVPESQLLWIVLQQERMEVAVVQCSSEFIPVLGLLSAVRPTDSVKAVKT